MKRLSIASGKQGLLTWMKKKVDRLEKVVKSLQPLYGKMKELEDEAVHYQPNFNDDQSKSELEAQAEYIVELAVEALKLLKQKGIKPNQNFDLAVSGARNTVEGFENFSSAVEFDIILIGTHAGKFIDLVEFLEEEVKNAQSALVDLPLDMDEDWTEEDSQAVRKNMGEFESISKRLKLYQKGKEPKKGRR